MILLGLWITCLIHTISGAPVWKIGNTTNRNIQTGELVLFNSTLPLNITNYFSITFPTPMTTDVLQGGVGLVGISSIIERQQGWTLYIDQMNRTNMIVQAYSHYHPSSPSSMISYIQIRWIISSHPNVGITFGQVNFNATSHSVANASTNDLICNWIRCRRTSITSNYPNKGAGNDGIGVIAGYSIFNILNETEFNSSQVFVNYTVQNYFGIAITAFSFGVSSYTAYVYVYGYTLLNQISIYTIVYQSTITNTNYSRIISGYGLIGCYYDVGGCTIKIKINSNTTFTTATTSLDAYFDERYFFGLSSFILLEEIDDDSFLVPSSSFTLPNSINSFNTISTTLDGTSGKYNTTFIFNGNVQNKFSFKFSYLIELNFDCPPGLYHLNATHCDSACPSNRYLNATIQYCLACNSRCASCTGPSNTECINCLSSQKRMPFNSTCICNISMSVYDNGVSDNCQPCHYSCLTCSSAGNNSCMSCNSSNFRYYDNASSCPCSIGYYDSFNKTKCQKCNETCLTCDGNASNNCIMCPSLRSFNNGSCQCIDGYYEYTVNLACMSCLYSCATCSDNATYCTSCHSANSTKRSLQSATKTCICVGGYYDDGVSPVCKLCFSTCVNCNGPTSKDCTTCNNTKNRAFNSPTGECMCMVGFYDYNNLCYACHYSCLNCTNNTDTSCLNCKTTAFRVFDSTNNKCVCDLGYYQNGVVNCSVCDFTCLTCSLSPTNCNSCSSTEYRILVGNQCKCMNGYVDILGNCTKCAYSCLTCNGISTNQCLSCNTTGTERYLFGSKCLCKDGFYDDGMNLQCKPCHIQCLTCSAGANNTCLTCHTSYNRWIPATTPNYCFCMAHYYDTGPATCALCDSKCQNCTGTATHCLTCYGSQNRQLNVGNKCVCKSHFYETGGDACLPCTYPCDQCVNSSTICTACPSLRTLINNSCPCVSNRYHSSITNSCQLCGVLCKQCVNTSTTCTQCYPTMYRQLNNTQCDCIFGYYYDGVDPNCKICPYFCVNCTSATNCQSCDSSAHRTLLGGICKCIDGYYDGGSLVCLACSPLCLTCSDYAVCTGCNSALNRTLITNQCKCTGANFDNYTLANNITMCQPCHYSCATCSGPSSSNCITCKANRNFTSYSCPCNEGYFEALSICYICDINCKTCVGASTYCTSCHTGLPLINNTCLCSSGQFYDSGTCKSCGSQCQECEISATQCTKCPASQLTTLVGTSCVCQNETYQNNLTLACIPCEQTCVHCVGPYSNNCTLCNSSDPIFRILVGNQCVCLSNYFLNTTSNMCQACDSVCTSCVGPSQYNCTGCIVNYTLIGSFCQQNISCVNYYYQNQCVNVCPKTSYPTTNHTCQKCTNGCLYCLTQSKCITCLPEYFYNSTTYTCIATCQNGMYIDSSGNCVPCISNCLECQWSSTKNLSICLKCAGGYFLKDQIQCSQICLTPYYVPIGSLCLKCLGNCLTCSALSVNNCTLCQPGTAFLSGQCYKQCPEGYYLLKNKGTQSTCETCPPACLFCQLNLCLICKQGYYLSNGECVEQGNFFNLKANKTQKCHPNCLSCTNNSFASCIVCRPFRGDDAELAISGYCECKPGGIDMGNGVCDHQKYTKLLQMTQSLVSYSSSSMYMMGLVSIITKNYIGIIGMLAYVQSYSTFYYVNSSLVMNINYVLNEYHKTNINSFFQSQTRSSESVSGRLLMEYQNEKSLFLRDQPYQYLIEWAMVPAIVIAFIWAGSIVMYLYLRFFVKTRVQNSYEQANELWEKNSLQNNSQSDAEPNKIFPTQPQIQNEEDNIRNSSDYLKGSLNKSNKSKKEKQNDKMLAVNKYVYKFFGIYHESVAIAAQLIFSGEIVFYAIVSLKLFRLQTNTSYILLVLSLLFFIYIIAYNMRLLIGIILFSKNLQKKEFHTTKEISRFRQENSLRILFHMHDPRKIHALNSIYLPLLLIRNQLVTIFMVTLSFNPTYQIAACGSLFALFTIYSLIFCPYRTLLRICLHLSQLLLIAQIVILLLVIETQYGNFYTLQILKNNGSLYKFAWTLLALNYFQMTIYIVMALILILNLSKQKFCHRTTAVHNAIQKQIVNQNITALDKSNKTAVQTQIQKPKKIEESQQALIVEEDPVQFYKAIQEAEAVQKKKSFEKKKVENKKKKIQSQTVQKARQSYSPTKLLQAQGKKPQQVVVKKYRIKRKSTVYERKLSELDNLYSEQGKIRRFLPRNFTQYVNNHEEPEDESDYRTKHKQYDDFDNQDGYQYPYRQ